MKPLNIIITGATSGLGKSILYNLIKRGANIAFCGRSEQKMNDIISDLNLPESKLWGKCFDITDEKNIESFVSDAHKKFGGIDVLINNAGANTAKGNLVDIKTSDFDYMTAVNFRAPFIFSREVARLMIPQKSGLFVNIQSTVCRFANPGMGSYTSTKSAFDSLTNTIRKEMREHNIRTLSVYPGGIDTPFRYVDKPDYMDSDAVADVVCKNIYTDDAIALDEIVLRPLIERNFF